jgi:hypothetical protein
MSFRSLVFDHVWLKLFSLVLATLIWLAVWAGLPRKSGLETTRIFVGRPIQLLAASPDHPRVVLTPDRATVTVRGPEDLLQGLKDDDVDAFVRLPDKRQFSGSLPLHVHVPAGASVAAVAPVTTQVNSATTDGK